MSPENRRRTTRVPLSVPIKVSGTLADGKPFEEQTTTVVIDGHGAQIVLKNHARPGERLTITNLRSGKACPFRLGQRAAKSLSGQAEWGVECLDTGANFWGIYFPVPGPPPPPAETEVIVAAPPPVPAETDVIVDAPLPAPEETETIEAWLECLQCGSEEMVQLTKEEYKTLGKTSSFKRGCKRCAAPTNWGYSYIETEETVLDDPASSSGPGPARGGIENRKARRLSLKLPVRIRLADGREEAAKTENLSKTGLCVASGAQMDVGDAIRLVFGYTEPGTGTEVLGRVVRRQELEGTNMALYGVHLEQRS